jgi:putative endonuclease
MDATITTEALERKANSSVTEYLTRRGYTILEHNWECEAGCIAIIATDDEAGDLVFIDIKVEGDIDKGLPAEHSNRARFEMVAASYLSEHPGMGTVEVRFDVVSLVVVGDGRAFLRHHRSALSSLGD